VAGGAPALDAPSRNRPNRVLATGVRKGHACCDEYDSSHRAVEHGGSSSRARGRLAFGERHSCPPARREPVRPSFPSGLARDHPDAVMFKDPREVGWHCSKTRTTLAGFFPTGQWLPTARMARSGLLTSMRTVSEPSPTVARRRFSTAVYSPSTQLASTQRVTTRSQSRPTTTVRRSSTRSDRDTRGCSGIGGLS